MSERIVAVNRRLTREEVLDAAKAAGLTDVRVVERRTIATYVDTDPRPRFWWVFVGDPYERFIEIPARSTLAELQESIEELVVY